eukprot:Skav217857  [mRNA]  locus=scaffold5889:68106:73523:- [translate_table: standard]
MFNALRRWGSNSISNAAARLPGLSPVAPQLPSSLGAPWASPLGAVRWKQVKVQSYWKPPRAKPCGQRIPKKPHVGPKANPPPAGLPIALPGEYTEIGRVICKQRRYLAKNPHVTRKRHFKHLAAKSSPASVMVMNVLAEPREEFLKEATRLQGTPLPRVLEEENDPEFQITDVKYKNFHGQAAQR